MSPVSIQERGAFTPVASPRKSARVQLEDDYVKVDQAEEEEGMQSPRYKCLNCKKATCALSPTKGTTQDHAHRVMRERRDSVYTPTSSFDSSSPVSLGDGGGPGWDISSSIDSRGKERTIILTAL